MRLKKRRWVLLCGLAVIFSVAYCHIWKDPPIASYEGKSVSVILKMMPSKDRERLEYFFRESIGWDALGYVLFGNKPMSFGGCDQKINPFKDLSSFHYAISPRRIQSKNGFETWRKYERLFPMSQFVVLYEETPIDVTFLFINRKNFIQIVERYADTFKCILNREVTGEDLLKEGATKSLLSEVLANHDELIGMLLGFGRENAHLYHLRSQLTSAKEKTDFNEKFHYGYPWEKEEEELNENFESVGWISAYITGGHLKNLDLITLPGFCAVVDHPETLHLKQDYLKTREKIIDYYKDKDFLEATLTMLTSN
jgi:hypothetical protein